MDNSLKKFDKVSGDVLLSLAASFLLLLYAPTMLYINNALDFSFDIYDVWQNMIVVALAAFGLSMLLLIGSRIVNEKLHSFLVTVYLAVLTAMMIQGNFLSGSIPVLDGNEIDWSGFTGMRMASAVVWVCCFCFYGILLIHKKRKAILSCSVYIGGIVLVFLVLSLGITLLTSKTAFTEKNHTTMTADGAFEMSEENNFVIFLLDGIDEKEFEKVLDTHSEYLDVFEDFTAFSNVMAMYPYTTRAVPYILFGEKYDNTYFYSLYLQNAIADSPFFQQLKERNFDTRVYFEYLYLTEVQNSDFRNFINVEKFKNPDKFCKMLIKLTGLQYLPYEIKKYCVVTPEDIYLDTLKTVEGQNIDFYSFNNQELYERIKNSDISKTDSKCFRFLYSQGAHAPWQYDAQMNSIENATYDDAIECSVTLADSYIKKLKEAGVYDNTVIIFLADHGMNIENPDSDYGKQNPILLIKGLNEHHPFVMNDAPVSHSDLQQAYLRLLDGCLSCDAFNWKEGEERERIHLISDVVIESDIYEYISDQHASDSEALTPTGVVYPFDWDTIIMEDAIA